MCTISDRILTLNPRRTPVKQYDFSCPTNTYTEFTVIHTFQGIK